MSSAAPPPPAGHPSATMNGYGSHAQSNGYGSHSSSSGGSGKIARILEHIVDLKVKADEALTAKGQPYAPISHLLEAAQESSRQAEIFETYRRPDQAYTEYLVASEIVVNIIPRHKEYVTLQSDRGRLHRQWRDLIKKINSQEARYASIRDIIINDNKRNGTFPRLGAPTSLSSQGPPIHSNQIDNRGIQSPNARYSMPSAPLNYEGVGPSRGSLDASQLPSSGRSTPTGFYATSNPRPPSNSKPQSLHGQALANGAASRDALAERFARLRTTPQPESFARVNTTSVPASGRNSWDYAVKMPSPTDYQPSESAASKRPLGPRTMPNVPGVPPKLPLDTTFSMPKAPSPTYSPARNMETPGGINPPRSTARSMVGTGGRSNSLASSVSAQTPNGSGPSDSYFPAQANNSKPQAVNRRVSIGLPSDNQVEAEKLFDYLRMYNVLLVDVRNREDFDYGHIYAHQVMCIEPTTLKPNMSAEQLQDSLILSPDNELSWFVGRDQFDLVVFYDQSTYDANFLDRPIRNQEEEALKCLYDSLTEFNFEKPLKRPPILLKGGLDAWADLMGTNALGTSKTQAIVSQQNKSARPIRRVAATRNMSINLQNKRRRDFTSLDPEEEQRWLEKARSERAALDSRFIPEEGDLVEEPESGSSIYRTTEDFLRRFPEPSMLDQQSMVLPPKRAQIEPAYTQPQIPQVPSRPPPSVPRVSYGGVHERDSAVPTGSSNRGAQLATYIPPSRHPQYRLPKTGLMNFGVTCYMNSTVQCLNATIPLTQVFLDDRYINLVQRDNWKGSKGLMSEHYATLIKNLWQGDVRAVRPSSLRRLCARFNAEWGRDQQQDAKEFLEFLLDILHEDMNMQWSHPPLRALTERDEAYRERLPKQYAASIEWGRYSLRDKSIISDFFAGQHLSRLRCTTCHHTSTTFEAFYSLSVEIPRDRPADMCDCLRSYCAEERLSGDEVWKCPRCKQEREATKQITMTRAPHFLIMHFKRFSASHDERARKVRTQIEFPLTGFDLGPFMVPSITPAEENVVLQQNDGANQLKKLKSDITMNGPYIYNAYGVVRHLGNTLSSGHYISMVKDNARNCWRQFNDERVNDFDPETLPRAERLQNEQAYIVFYERDRSLLR